MPMFEFPCLLTGLSGTIAIFNTLSGTTMLSQQYVIGSIMLTHLIMIIPLSGSTCTCIVRGRGGEHKCMEIAQRDVGA